MEVYDGHIHSKHSHDSNSDIDAICKTAIERNIKGIAITDHYQGANVFKTDILENIRTSTEDTKRAKKKFEKDLFVGIGVEMGEPSCNYEAAAHLADLTEFDVIIGAVHILKSQEKSHARTDFSVFSYSQLNSYMQEYFEDILEISKNADFDVLAHLTFPLQYINGKYNFNYDISQCNKIIGEVLTTIIDRNIALELNVSNVGGSWGEYVPNEDILRRYKEMGGNMVALGSDAHKEETVGNNIKEGMEYLLKCGFTHNTFFKRRRPYMVKIGGA